MTDITFSTIPANELLPGVYIETAGDNPALPDQNALIIGQRITSYPNTPVFISSVQTAVNRFGARSQLATMIQSYLFANPESPGVWALPYADNGAGTAATGTLLFAGTATAAGTIFLYVAGRYVPVAVNVGDTAAAIATNVVAALTAYTDARDKRGTFSFAGLGGTLPNRKKRRHRFVAGCQLPVTAAVDGTITAQVNLTAANKGTAGNGINVQLNYLGAIGQETLPAGITCTVTAMASGATDPDITNLDAVLINTPFDFIVIPWNTATQLNLVQTFLSNATGRWAANRQIYGHCFAARRAAGNNGTDAATFALTRNDPHTTVVHFENTVPNAEFDVAASFAGTFALSSMADPAMPTHNLPIPAILAPARDNHFSYAVREQLLGDGAALMAYNADGTCKILRAVTTYQTDVNGTPDQSYRDTETLYTLMAVNRRLKADYLAAYPRAKLADDGTSFGPGSQFSGGLPNQPIATPNGIKAVLIQSYSRMANVDAWVTDIASFAQNIVVQRRSTDPSRVDVLYPIILIGGLRVTGVLNLFQLQQGSAAAAA